MSYISARQVGVAQKKTLCSSANGTMSQVSHVFRQSVTPSNTTIYHGDHITRRVQSHYRSHLANDGADNHPTSGLATSMPLGYPLQFHAMLQGRLLGLCESLSTSEQVQQGLDLVHLLSAICINPQRALPLLSQDLSGEPIRIPQADFLGNVHHWHATYYRSW